MIAAGEHAHCEVTGTLVTDLPSPGRYLRPGRLVLTNGLWRQDVPAARWIGELVDAGVPAIGYGLSDDDTAVPEDVVSACTAAGLPLVQVSAELSFTYIDDAIAEAAAQRREAELRRRLSREHRLVEALGRGGFDRLLATLDDDDLPDLAVVSPDGRVVAWRGSPPPPETARAAARAARQRSRRAGIGDAWSSFAARTPGEPPHSLLVHRPLAQLAAPIRETIDQLVPFLAVQAATERAARDALLALANELVALLHDGDASPAMVTARLGVLGLEPEAPITVIASAGSRTLLDCALAGLGLSARTAAYRGLAIALVAGAGDVLPALRVALEDDFGEAPTLGAGRTSDGCADLRRSLVEALHAVAVARGRPSGDRVVRHSEVGSHRLILDLVDPDALAAFQDAVLGIVERWDAEHHTGLVETLRTFLDCDGRWAVAAQALHVHQNTVRQRLERVERLTGRRLESTADRVDFQLALAHGRRATGRPGRVD